MEDANVWKKGGTFRMFSKSPVRLRHFLVAASAVVVSLGGPASAKELRFAHVYETNTPFHEGILRAAEEIAQKTGGRHTMKVFPASSLGSEEALNEGLSLGSVDVIYTGPSFMSRSYPSFAIADYPYVFRNFDHWKAFWRSDLLKDMADGYRQKTKNVLIAATYYGERHVTSNKPILKPADMKGLKIRIANAPAYILFPKAIGANPTPLAFSEVYLALQQGVIDAQENPLPTIRSKKFYEVQSNINLTGHITSTLTIVMSGLTYNGMAPADREIIATALRSAADWTTEQIRTQEKDLISWFRGQGIQVNEVDRKAFAGAVKPALESSNHPWTPDVFKKLEAM